MVKELQLKYDALTKEINVIENKRNDILNKAKENGFALFGGIFKEDKKVYGAFYDMTYYSHFDGHLSEAIENYYSGASKISSEDFNILKNLIIRYQSEEDKQDDDSFIDELNTELNKITVDICEDFWTANNFWSFFEIKDKDTIEWCYYGDEDQGELCDDSEVIFRLSTESEIASIEKIDND